MKSFFKKHLYLWKVIIIYHIILGSTVYLWAAVFAYYIILGSTVYLWKVVFTILLFMIKVKKKLQFFL